MHAHIVYSSLLQENTHRVEIHTHKRVVHLVSYLTSQRAGSHFTFVLTPADTERRQFIHSSQRAHRHITTHTRTRISLWRLLKPASAHTHSEGNNNIKMSQPLQTPAFLVLIALLRKFHTHPSHRNDDDDALVLTVRRHTKNRA